MNRLLGSCCAADSQRHDVTGGLRLNPQRAFLTMTGPVSEGDINCVLRNISAYLYVSKS